MYYHCCQYVIYFFLRMMLGISLTNQNTICTDSSKSGDLIITSFTAFIIITKIFKIEQTETFTKSLGSLSLYFITDVLCTCSILVNENYEKYIVYSIDYIKSLNHVVVVVIYYMYHIHIVHRSLAHIDYLLLQVEYNMVLLGDMVYMNDIKILSSYYTIIIIIIFLLRNYDTVEPLYCRQHWDKYKCPDYRDVPMLGVNLYYKAQFGIFVCVLNTGVSSFRVSSIEGFHVLVIITIIINKI